MSQTHSYTPSLHQHPAHPPISHTHTCKFAHTRKNTDTHATPKTLWHVHKATNRYASNISLWIAPSTCRSFARTRVVSLLSRTRALDSLFFSLFLCLALSFSRFLASLALSCVCAPSLSLSKLHAHTGRTRQEISFHLRAQSGPGCRGGDLRSAQSIQRQAVPPAILGWPTEAQALGDYAVSEPTFKD